jgi:hypothetical protein
MEGFPKSPRANRNSKCKHRLWDQAGRPRDGHNLFLDIKALRKQQRKERAIEGELFMKKLESKPD